MQEKMLDLYAAVSAVEIESLVMYIQLLMMLK